MFNVFRRLPNVLKNFFKIVSHILNVMFKYLFVNVFQRFFFDKKRSFDDFHDCQVFGEEIEILFSSKNFRVSQPSNEVSVDHNVHAPIELV